MTYLSIAWVSRNDDHGGQLIPRIQAAVDALDEHMPVFPFELIFVEWNPPRDRERLSEAIRFPVGFPVRWIVISPELHQTLPNWERFSLYPHLGANVAMRRAHGKFVLTTTHDIVWSEGMGRAVRAKDFDPGKVYRAARWDGTCDLGAGLSVAQRIASMEQAMIRRTEWREGVFTKSCGDFILMARDRWHSMRGYAELTENGIWLDGLLLHSAIHGGAEQCVIPHPIYHMEHDGRGLDIYKTLPHMPRAEYLVHLAEMRHGKPAPQFNSTDWGMARAGTVYDKKGRAVLIPSGF